MIIKLIHAETNALTTFDNILRAPDKWQGWHCICINDPDLDCLDSASDKLLAIEQHLHDYLQDVPGELYLAGFENILLFCKEEHKQLMQETIENLSIFLNPEALVRQKQASFDLGNENSGFIEYVRENCRCNN